MSSRDLALYQAPVLSPEEIEKREKEAEELDKKLRHIVEDVPDRIYHIMGSCAGAGSGDFHTYRHSRRREQERLKRIREEHAKETLNKEFKERLESKLLEDDAKTAARRAKRLKQKEKKQQKKKQRNQDDMPQRDNAGKNTVISGVGNGNEQEQEDPGAVQADLD